MTSSIRSIRKQLVRTASAAALAALALACATTPTPTPVARPSANQQVIYEDGAEKIISMRPTSMVSLRIAELAGRRSSFVVGVANQMTYPVVIGPEMVTVLQSGRSLRVFSYEEVAEQERSAKQNAMITRAILGGVTSGLASLGGISTSPAYFAGAQSGLEAAQQGLATSSSQHDITLKEISTTSLKKNTLFPTQQGGGVVYTEEAGAGPLHVRVQISEDVHDFEFDL